MFDNIGEGKAIGTMFLRYIAKFYHFKMTLVNTSFPTFHPYFTILILLNQMPTIIFMSGDFQCLVSPQIFMMFGKEKQAGQCSSVGTLFVSIISKSLLLNKELQHTVENAFVLSSDIICHLIAVRYSLAYLYRTILNSFIWHTVLQCY
jgi:hypothetical protein